MNLKDRIVAVVGSAVFLGAPVAVGAWAFWPSHSTGLSTCDDACEATRAVQRGQALVRAAEAAQASAECRYQAEIQRIHLIRSGMPQSDIISPDCSG